MKPCWRDHGLNEHGAELADKALSKMTKILFELELDKSVAQAVLNEAVFRAVELPNRTPAFYQQYLTKNAEKKP